MKVERTQFKVSRFFLFVCRQITKWSHIWKLPRRRSQSALVEEALHHKQKSQLLAIFVR